MLICELSQYYRKLKNIVITFDDQIISTIIIYIVQDVTIVKHMHSNTARPRSMDFLILSTARRMSS